MFFSLRSTAASVTLLAACSMGIATAPHPAHAGNDFIKGLVIGGAVGAIINNETKKKRRATTSSRSRSTAKPRAPAGPRATIAVFPTTRAEVRDYQTRLNALGFDAGTPDGISGKRTRAAVSRFQGSIGAPETGKLTQAEAGILVQRTSQTVTAAAPGTVPGLATAGAMAPAPAFPSTGGAATAGAPSPAFPVAGGTQQPQANAPAPTFPVIGGTAAGQPAAPAPVFPQAGAAPQGQMAAAAPSPTFPQATTQGQATNAAPTFPVAAAAPQAAAPAPTFPAVTGTSAAMTPDPAPVQPVPAAAVTVEATEAPAADALVAEADAQRFSILGVSAGQDLSAAQQQLAFEGVTDCEADAGLTICASQSPALQDLVSLKSEETTDGAIKVGAMSRHLTFTQPLARADLTAMMADRYGALLDAPNMMLGSADCLSLANLTTGGRAELTARIMSGDSASLSALAKSCGHFARIVLSEAPGTQDVEEVSIFLFEGAVFADSKAAAAPRIKF